jgi:hypothetical protein
MEADMWRYRVEIFDIEANGKEAFEGLLSDAGQDRWELITISKAFNQLVLVFKKPAA